MKNISKIIHAISLTVCASLAIACTETTQPNMDLTDLSVSNRPIINGIPDTSPEHNAVVAFYYDLSKNKVNKAGIICTGTLVHPQWVLTATHCLEDFEGGDITQYLVYIAFGNNESELRKNLYNPISYVVHKNYGEQAMAGNPEKKLIHNDIALIKLAKPVPSSVAKPILPLPKWLSINNQSIMEGIEMVFSGYGVDKKGNTATKLKITLPANQYCGPANRDDGNECFAGDYVVNGCSPDPNACDYVDLQKYCENNKLCFYDVDINVWIPSNTFFYTQEEGGPCQGDSGGPGFVRIGGIEYLAAITSYGDAICSVTGVSTAVQDFHDWIRQYAPEIEKQYVEICNNNVDDDGDGNIDCKDDPSCRCEEVDMASSDSDTSSPASSTTDPSPDSQDSSTPEICDNLVDDDGDGLIDCRDPECRSDHSCQIYSAFGCHSAPDSSSGNSVWLLLLSLLALIPIFQFRSTGNHKDANAR